MNAPELTINEALLIVDATNGIIIHPDILAEQLLWMNVEDAIQMDALDKKWEVDGAALVNKLKALSNQEAVTLLEKIKQFWGEQYHQANSRQRVIDIGFATEPLITPTEAAKLSGKSLQALAGLAAKGVITRYNDPNEPNPQRRTRYVKSEIKKLGRGRMRKA